MNLTYKKETGEIVTFKATFVCKKNDYIIAANNTDNIRIKLWQLLHITNPNKRS